MNLGGRGSPCRGARGSWPNQQRDWPPSLGREMRPLGTSVSNCSKFLFIYLFALSGPTEITTYLDLSAYVYTRCFLLKTLGLLGAVLSTTADIGISQGSCVFIFFSFLLSFAAGVGSSRGVVVEGVGKEKGRQRCGPLPSFSHL